MHILISLKENQQEDVLQENHLNAGYLPSIKNCNFKNKTVKTDQQISQKKKKEFFNTFSSKTCYNYNVQASQRLRQSSFCVLTFVGNVFVALNKYN